MQFLADENFPQAAVLALQAAGHDVLWVANTQPGAPDTDVLARATREHRILLTFDKDFGELATRALLPPDCAVVLLRIPPPRTSEAARKLADVVTARTDWAGHFSVIEPGRIRMRPLG